jgi:tetratricopeptide (TPR) repeat protein
LKSNMLAFSSYYHSRYQQQAQAADLQQAKYWYDRFFHYFPHDGKAGDTHFLYAELLNDSGELSLALQQYDLAAKFKQNAKSAEAAYAAIVTMDKLANEDADPRQREQWLLKKTDQALQFAQSQPRDPRAANALMNVLEKLYQRKLYKQSVKVADSMFVLPERRYYLKTAVIKADSLLQLQEYADAEKLYRQVSTQANDAERNQYTLDERIATAIYKQGEYSASKGEFDQAVQHYLRVKSVAPQSSVAPLAEFDAAVLLIKHKSFAQAVPVLERFRRVYPGHRLQSKAVQNLALAYAQTGKTPCGRPLNFKRKTVRSERLSNCWRVM